MKAVQPLISCICVTNKRPEMLTRAIQCFKRQTYPNKAFILLQFGVMTIGPQCLLALCYFGLT